MKKFYLKLILFLFFTIQIVFSQSRQPIGFWVDETGKLIAHFSGEYLFIADDILNWSQNSGFIPFPENGFYTLNISEDGTTASDGIGNRYGGYSINASFSFSDDGTMILIIENSTYDNNEDVFEEWRQTFRLSNEEK